MMVLLMVLVAVIVLLTGVVVWLCRPGGYRGGTIDLTGVRPTGELDLDWADPRPYVRISADTSRFAQDVEGLRPIGTERTSAA